MISNAAKNFDILATSLNVLHNYFEYFNEIIFKSVSKFLDTSTKPFFSVYTCLFTIVLQLQESYE